MPEPSSGFQCYLGDLLGPPHPSRGQEALRGVHSGNRKSVSVHNPPPPSLALAGSGGMRREVHLESCSARTWDHSKAPFHLPLNQSLFFLPQKKVPPPPTVGTGRSIGCVGRKMRAQNLGGGGPCHPLTPVSLNRVNLGDIDVVRALETISHFCPYPAA